jgi:hypothetical protein
MTIPQGQKWTVFRFSLRFSSCLPMSLSLPFPALSPGQRRLGGREKKKSGKERKKPLRFSPFDGILEKLYTGGQALLTPANSLIEVNLP